MTDNKDNKVTPAPVPADQQAQPAADNYAPEPVDETNFEEGFSLSRSLKLGAFLPVGIVAGWLLVSFTGGLGFEAKKAAEEAAEQTAKATKKVDPVAEEARRVANETAQRVATRVSTDVATRVARDVASRVARDTAIRAIESAQ